jgi:hypothetical protein
VQITEKPIEPEAKQTSGIRLKYVRAKPVKRNTWIEVIAEVKWLSWGKIKSKYEECSELLAIFTSAGNKFVK